MHLADHVTDVQLNEYLDNETAERAEIEMHLSSCDECAARLSTLQNVFTELDSLPELALTKSLSEASPWDAAPFTPRPSLPAQLPKFLTLTAILQTAFAIVAAVIAAPFMASLLPILEMPSFATMFINLQSQWVALLDQLSTFHFQPVTFNLPTLEMTSLLFTLAGVSVLWILGNGLLLRNQR
ncbi:MAG: hypothetical protein HY864_13545 [Chloroflexi bacterium]|nr:hypothetical protein [Chloroflexota bacterium]